MLHFLIAVILLNTAASPGADTLPHGASKGHTAPSEKPLLFSGYEWKVRNVAGLQGPGPNYFSGESVWVDDKGFLHLFLHRDSATGKWLCAEITSVESFGYGAYSFSVDGAIDKFDKNIVLGLFNYSGNDGLDEMDIEMARWGHDSIPNLNYTVWPAVKNLKNTTYAKQYMQQNSFSTQQFVRSRDSVVFSTCNGDTMDSKSRVAGITFTQPPASLSTLAMPVHLNLWLFKGIAPADGKPVEVIIHSFSFLEQ